MPIIPVGADGFYHPKSDDEIIELIKHANQNKLQVRVRGAAHSVNQAIFADAGGLNLMLDQMNKVEIDKRKMQVTVQAGCHLGRDPYDPAGVSNLENSLLYQLDQKGLAVPDLGGIIHQAVGGFVSTGSSGGSLNDSFGEAIIAITLIDGTGKKHQVTRAGKEDLFFAAGVSMGLLGIITEVTFSLVKKFDIKGEQTTTTVAGCEVDLFGPGGNGKPSLQEFLIKTPYTRLMWWPQNGVERMVIWKAHQMQEAEYDASTGTRENFKPQPYLEFPMFGKLDAQGSGFAAPDIPSEGPSEKLAEAAGGLFYSVVGNWHLLLKKLNPSFFVRLALKFVGWLYPKHIMPAVINAFNPFGTQQFWDVWWRGLPMDNRVDDKLVPTDFTEIWIPLTKTAEVMRRLRDFYKEKGYEATGSYSCELYAAKNSDFWLSPSYGEDMFRVDVFWFGYSEDNPVLSYYPQFWELLKNFPCRFHWGKYMPEDPQYLKKQYPKWDEFMALRAQLDPSQIFVTDYWRQRLGIGPSTPAQSTKPSPPAQRS